MKRAAVDHPKLQRLQRRLSLSRFQAMGLMEALWHFTGRYAPQGDIGRWSDEEIAAWIEWPGDPEELVQTLVTCGWLDEHPACRLVVHDWADHADEATKVSLKRAGKAMIVATVPNTEETPSQPVATLSRPPEPEPCHARAMPVPEPCTSAAPAAPDTQAPRLKAADWDAFLDTYPARNGDRGTAKGREKFAALVKSGVPPGDLLDGVRRYRAWADAEGKTGSEFVKQIPSWLNGKCWQEAWASGGNRNGQQRQNGRHGAAGNTLADKLADLERDYAATFGPDALAGPEPRPAASG